MRSLRKSSRRKVRGRVSKTARRVKRRVSKRRASKRRIYKRGVSKRRVSKKRVLKRRVSKKRISRRNLRGGSPLFKGGDDEIEEVKEPEPVTFSTVIKTRMGKRKIKSADNKMKAEVRGELEAMELLEKRFAQEEIDQLVIVKPNFLKNVEVGDRVIPGFSRAVRLKKHEHTHGRQPRANFGDYPPPRPELHSQAHMVMTNGGTDAPPNEHYPKIEKEVSRGRNIGIAVEAIAVRPKQKIDYPEGTNFGTIETVHDNGVVEVKWDEQEWPAPEFLQYRCGASFRSEDGYDAFYDLKLAHAEDQPSGGLAHRHLQQTAAAAVADEQEEPEPEPEPGHL